MNKNPNRAVRLWLVVGLLAYVALPWYAIQDTAWYSVLPQILGGPETSSGIVQALVHGRKWLLVGLIGLMMATVGLSMPAGRAQGNWFVAGGLVGFLGLLISAFSIGSKGWLFELLNAQFGALATNQFGIGIGAFFALLALVMITAFGIARKGYFKGDLFIASAVLGCSVMLILFIAFPVTKALYGAFLTEEGPLVDHRSVQPHWQRAGVGFELPDRWRALRCRMEHVVPRVADGNWHHHFGHDDGADGRT